MGDLRVRLLGGFQLTLNAGPAERPIRRKAQELLALVLLAPQRYVLRETAAEALWPSAGAEVSRKSMRQVLWQVHQATDPGGSRLVLTEGEVIRINPDRRVWLDVDAFVAASRSAWESGPRRAPRGWRRRSARTRTPGRNPPRWTGYRLPSRPEPARRGPAVRAKLRVPAKLTAIPGVATSRAADLRAAGIRSVVALASAEVATVAELPGISEKMAESFIAEAKRLVRERGEHVLFDR